MSHHSLLILNRKSGSNPETRKVVKAVESEADLEVRIPWSKKQMRKDIERAVERGCRRIIAGGGDGTINTVVNVVLKADLAGEVSFGVMPLGTANDLARSFGDTADDIAASLRRAVAGAALATDVGRVNGTHFVNVASGGFGAMITATTPSEMKQQLGGLAYSLHGLSRLSELRPQRCRVALDGGAAFDIELRLLAVGNSRFAGGGFDVTPEARMDDGVLDLAAICLGRSRHPGLLVRELMNPTSPENEVLVYRTFQQCVLDMEEPFHMNLDGEPTQADRFEIEVLPAAIRMVR